MSIRKISIAAATLALTACSSNFVSTWQDPATTGRTFDKIAVFAITKDKSVRRTTENAFVMSLTGTTKVVPSYQFATDDELKDKAKVVAKMKEGGFDGAVIFRVIAIDERTEEYKSANYIGAYYGSFYYTGFDSYWGYYGAPVYSGTYSVKTQIAQIEAALYAVADNKLVFAQQSKMKNPDSTMDVIEAVVRDAAKAMQSAKLVH
jgi:hypothetical protein